MDKMKQKIACIGWGSLIWDPRKLKIENNWFSDGPVLPIEFSRISNNSRVTLIIDRDAQPVKTLWALMSCNDIDEAKESLRDREDVRDMSLIHFVHQNDNVTDKIQVEVQNWLKSKQLDSAIWTGLSFSKKTNNDRPSIENIISHLDALNMESRQLAEEYIRNAPKQIETEYRRLIEKKFGWYSL